MTQVGDEGRPQIKWYRCRVPREELSRLNKRSNLRGAVQTLGFLAILMGNAALAWYSALHWRWYVTVALVFWHGTCWHFLINGFHELVHESVFRTRWLNRAFLRLFAFLSWNNHHWFFASHMEHHKYTLHEPDDLEVVLPVKMTLGGYLAAAFVRPIWIYHTLRVQARRALGVVNPGQDRWTGVLFPESNVEGRRNLVNWARVLLVGHVALAAGALAMGWWMLPILVTVAPAYGRWLHILCNESQHTGLTNHTPDYRLCCRTIYLNPFLRFLYWHMNYHTEHHMYAAVPCYNLHRLHGLIRQDMPPCPRGLVATWRNIIQTLRRQKDEPDYAYVAPLPPPAANAVAGA